jgi:pimeloyl-ACP methyl ester carboxylesterase
VSEGSTGRWLDTRDGRRLWAEEHGEGSPVVVLESGMGVSHHMWGAVTPLLAARTRVVAYDRSGLGASPADTAARTLSRLTDDLVDVLAQLGGGPFVLVGHSWGGPVVRCAAAAMAEHVTGLVLVDPTEETCELFFSRASAVQAATMVPLLPLLARTGVLRVPARRFAELLPEHAATGMRTQDGTLVAARAQAAELRSHTDDLRRLRSEPPLLPEVPVTYLTGGRSSRLERGRRDELTAAHRRAADALPRGCHVIARGSGHYVPLTEPEVVANEVLRIVDEVRDEE